MRRHLASLGTLIAILCLALTAGCAPAATPAAPTQAAAAPTKAAAAPTQAAAAQAPAPTTAPASQPTAEPVKKSDYPTKGKTINAIVPSSAGGGSDTIARMLSPLMEKELQTTIQIVNKPGAGMQIGLTEALAAKPDGYNLFWSILPTTLGVYLDPERKATFGRKEIQTIGLVTDGPFVLVVRGDGPYKTVKDVVDAAKASPEKVKAATTGFMSTGHLGVVDLETAIGAKLAVVHFEGGGPARTALLGGHVDISLNSLGEIRDDVRAGTLRALAILALEESKFLSGVKTMASQGYKVNVSSSVGLSTPAGTPKDVIDTVASAIKKGMEDADFKQKMEQRGETLRYLGPDQYATYWNEQETLYKSTIEMALKDR